MRTIQHKTGPDGNNIISSSDRDIGDAFKKGVDNHIIEAINKANSIPIRKVIRQYKNIDENVQKITCPFPSHKGGREQTPSFYIYDKTNTFWCYGCNIGSSSCDFVSHINGIGKYAAADKILKILEAEAIYQDIDNDNYQSSLEYLCDFSAFIRENIRLYPNKFSKIEECCKKFDEMVYKHRLEENIDGLRILIEKLKNKLYLNLNP